MEKTGIVLEGGGIRGAYTAGALDWLMDHEVTFDYGVGISSGAFMLCLYMENRKETMKRAVLDYIIKPDIVGPQALLREGYWVGFKKLFYGYMRNLEQFSVKPLKDAHANIEVGAYDLDMGETVWFRPEDMDDEMEVLRGACSLPVVTETVDVNGRHLLDGGITKMIPIERSIEQGVTRHLVITTKPADYVRKPGPPIVQEIMKLVYKQCPQVAADYKVRHINYYNQMGIIDDLVNKGEAVLIRPSKTIQVSRWKGDPEKVKELYELGISDMEARKDEIFALLKKD
ncbi:MAG: patatin family protein [Erysipelotrichaceae bacterium]|nr:patatin family protein [Erysipelotrichaceae bacterium]MDO5122063.1 patatin family protein [Erysipelotrichaceae bacterium]